MSTQRMARNFPWVNRYVLHVSQIVLETADMLSCTGRALVCLYCTNPKIAPMKQIRMPKYIKVVPLTPPRPANLTASKGGILISASLPKAAVDRPKMARMSTPQNHRLLFLIIYRSGDYVDLRPPLPVHFCGHEAPRFSMAH